MNQEIAFEIREILPRREKVYRTQGIVDVSRVQDRVHGVYLESMELFTKKAEPVGILSELSVDRFRPIFEGEGNNAEENPVQWIYPRADHLALFALTLGRDLGVTIEDLFASKEFAIATMLDSVASLAADKAVEVLETRYQDQLLESERVTRAQVVLSYSPGYCGWYNCGKKRLCEYLHPEEIMVTIKESYLMSPPKSVTGVTI